MKRSSEKTITFDGQKPREQVIAWGRKHPLVLGKMGLVLVGAALIVFALFLKFGLSSITSYVFMLLLIIGGVYFARNKFIYSNSIYILTTERIISMDQKGFFVRRMSESPLDKIVNISYEVRGFLKTVFNFGDIIIQTSGSGNDTSIIKLIDIPSPDGLQKKIARTASEYAGAQIEVDLKK